MSKHVRRELGATRPDSVRASDSSGVAMAVAPTRTGWEPISPELVLVDPGLARARNRRFLEGVRAGETDRSGARLGREQMLRAHSNTEAPYAERLDLPPRGYPVRIAGALLATCAFAMGLLAAHVISRGPEPSARQASPPTTPPRLHGSAIAGAESRTDDRSPQRTTPTSRPQPNQALRDLSKTAVSTPHRATNSSSGARLESTQRATPRAPRSLLGEDSASVERRILSLVVQSPEGKVPEALIDRDTGLAKDNLQAVCRVDREAFLCVVRPAHHKPGEGLRVRYEPRRNGDGVLTWLRYRNG